MTVGHRLRKLKGVRYLSEAELRAAVEKILGHPVTDTDWDNAKPDYDPVPAYGELSLQETLYWFGYESKRQGKNRKIVKVKKRQQSLERLLGDMSWLSWHPTFRRLKPMAETYRSRELGLSHPVSPGMLRSTLLELGARESPEHPEKYLPPLPYPISISKSSDNVTILEIAYICIPDAPDNKLWTLPRYVLGVSSALGYHPAIVLAFLLCDIFLQEILVSLPILIRDRIRLNIYVPSPTVSPQIVSQVYTRARNEIMREIRGVKGKWTRPRQLSWITVELARFVRSTPNLSWGERVEKWNSEHPWHPYKSENSMAVVYSRVKKEREVNYLPFYTMTQ